MTVSELRSRLQDCDDDAKILVYIGSKLREIQPRLDRNVEGGEGYILDDLLNVVDLEGVKSDKDEVYLYLEDLN